MIIQNTQSEGNAPKTLSYYGKNSEPLDGLWRWVGWVAVIYALVCLGGNASEIAGIYPQTFGFWSIDGIGFFLIITNAVSVVGALLLLFAGIVILRMGRLHGPNLVMWQYCSARRLRN